MALWEPTSSSAQRKLDKLTPHLNNTCGAYGFSAGGFRVAAGKWVLLIDTRRLLHPEGLATHPPYDWLRNPQNQIGAIYTRWPPSAPQK
jgi:hypothetical protein